VKIAMMYENRPPFVWDSHDANGLGGSENCFIATAKYLVELGHIVHVFNLTTEYEEFQGGRFKWANLANFDPDESYDVLFSLRHREPFHRRHKAKLKVLFLADTESYGLGQDVSQRKIDVVMAVSHWQKEKIDKEEGIHGDHWIVTSNGVDGLMPQLDEKVPGRCVFIGTPERGLTSLLDIWPEIKANLPYASLDLYSSFVAWDNTLEENEKMMHDIYERADRMTTLGVRNYRHGNAAEIRATFQKADIYLYPTDFYETCCMSVLEGAFHGVIPVATGRAALIGKVIPGLTGFDVPAYGVNTPRYNKLFVYKTIEAITLAPAVKARYRNNNQLYAMQFHYANLVPAWAKEWEERLAAK